MKLLFALLLASGLVTGQTTNYTVTSPNSRLCLKVSTTPNIRYAVFCGGRQVLAPSPIAMTLGDGRVLGHNPQVVTAPTRKVATETRPVVPVKSTTIRCHYNELRLDCNGDYALTFRVFDEGVAYRFSTKLVGRIKIAGEEVVYNFGKQHKIYFPEEEKLITHCERLYKHLVIGTIKPKQFCSLPALVDLAGGPKVLLTETDLFNYPGLYLRGTGGDRLIGRFPAFVLEDGIAQIRNPVVKKRAPYLAHTVGTRTFPWRIMAISEKDGDLVANQLVHLLARPCQLKDTSWIKPGKVAWDWYNALNLFGVDFKAGVNTETYRHFIDFAAANDIEYVIFDEGWSDLVDLLKPNPKMDLPNLFAYAKEKKVGIILWVIWKSLDDQLTPALDQFQRWGAAGIKVDFMQRDDQWMVEYYERIAREAAKRHLLVDFHGSYKPAGLRRAYPNVITREGVKGLENNKWCDYITPEHNVTIPFIRMVAGPMDYTPGAMANAQKKNFRPCFTRPMSLGTRCHQLAMYVVYESPLQMLADSPSLYQRERECMEFLAAVPTVWDETRVLAAKVGDYILIARRRGTEWFIGGMTDWTARTLTVDLSFLGEGEYTARIYQDGTNADRMAQDYKKSLRKVNGKDQLKIKLAPGGGWAARIGK